MATNWPSPPLSSLVDPSRGISYGIVQPGAHHAEGIPIVRVSDMPGNGVDIANPLRVAPSIEAAYSRTRLRGGELLISIVGTVGNTAIVDEDLIGWNVARAVAVIPVLQEIGPYWIKCALKSPAVRQRIDNRLNTTVQATLNLRDLADLPISLPPPEIRNAVETVLGALDDKIELNRRTSETLEAMARAIFKDWFVDFGPTRAKMVGKKPYLAPDLWSHFPDRLDDQGKPVGWSRLAFGKLLESSLGGDWGKDAPDDENNCPVSIIRGTDFAEIASGGVGKIPHRFTPASKAKGRSLRDLDIVVEISGGSPTQPTGRCLLVTDSVLERLSGTVVCASFCRRFRAKSASEALFAHQHLSYLYSIGGTWEYQNQSTGISNFQTTHFLETELVSTPPNRETINAFARLVEPLVRRASLNESSTLASLRDLLLPKLMSGEIRIADAERIVGGSI